MGGGASKQSVTELTYELDDLKKRGEGDVQSKHELEKMMKDVKKMQAGVSEALEALADVVGSSKKEMRALRGDVNYVTSCLGKMGANTKKLRNDGTDIMDRIEALETGSKRCEEHMQKMDALQQRVEGHAPDTIASRLKGMDAVVATGEQRWEGSGQWEGAGLEALPARVAAIEQRLSPESYGATFDGFGAHMDVRDAAQQVEIDGLTARIVAAEAGIEVARALEAEHRQGQQDAMKAAEDAAAAAMAAAGLRTEAEQWAASLRKERNEAVQKVEDADMHSMASACRADAAETDLKERIKLDDGYSGTVAEKKSTHAVAMVRAQGKMFAAEKSRKEASDKAKKEVSRRERAERELVAMTAEKELLAKECKSLESTLDAVEEVGTERFATIQATINAMQKAKAEGGGDVLELNGEQSAAMESSATGSLLALSEGVGDEEENTASPSNTQQQQPQQQQTPTKGKQNAAPKSTGKKLSKSEAKKKKKQEEQEAKKAKAAAAKAEKAVKKAASKKAKQASSADPLETSVDEFERLEAQASVASDSDSDEDEKEQKPLILSAVLRTPSVQALMEGLPTDPGAITAMAEGALVAGVLDESERLFSAVLVLSPSSASAAWGMARTFAKAEDVTKCTLWLGRAVQWGLPALGLENVMDDPCMSGVLSEPAIAALMGVAAG